MLRHGHAAQQPFELREHQLDGVQVQTVGRQVQHAGSHTLDRFTHYADLVAGQVVHDQDVARTQCRNQMLPDVVHEHRTINDQWSGQASQSQAGQEGCRLPVPEGSMADQPLTTWRGGGSCSFWPRFHRERPTGPDRVPLAATTRPPAADRHRVAVVRQPSGLFFDVQLQLL